MITVESPTLLLRYRGLVLDRYVEFIRRLCHTTTFHTLLKYFVT